MSVPSLFDRSSVPDPQLREHASEINLSEWVQVVRRRWILLAATCVLGVTVASIHYVMTPKMYQATAISPLARRNLRLISRRCFESSDSR